MASAILCVNEKILTILVYLLTITLLLLSFDWLASWFGT